MDDDIGDEPVDAGADEPIVVVGSVEEVPLPGPSRAGFSVEDVIDLAEADVCELPVISEHVAEAATLFVPPVVGASANPEPDSDLRAMRRQLLLSAAALLEAVDQIDLVLSGRSSKKIDEAA